MSSPPRDEILKKIGFAIARWQQAIEAFDGAVAEAYDLSAAERRCIGTITHGPQPTSAIARAINLTPAAVTTLIDRLEARGFVRRQSDPNDRRKVMVVAAEKTEELVARAYHPIFLAGSAMLEGYSMDEMRLILRFVEAAEVMQKGQTERLRADPPPGGTTPR
jgi:DNA-binding MarR family transcriptional regulator